MIKANIIDMKRFRSLSGSDVLVSVETIGPEEAARWLKANRINRPVRQKHVEYLSRQMTEGQWQLNGQAIIVADTEDILDGQHRLQAVLDSGATIKTLVVYGITREAFRTIDTGAVRTGSDAIYVEFPGRSVTLVKAVAAAVPWCKAMERGAIKEQKKISNQESIDYVNEHPSMWACAETILSYPKQNRPLPVGMGTALLELFQRRDQELAQKFFCDLYTGELLKRGTPVYVLREMLLKDAQRKTASYSASVRMKMGVKAWNLCRRKIDSVGHQNIAINPKDPDYVRIF